MILEGSRGRLRLREAAAVSSAVVRDLEEFLVGRAAAAAAAVAVAAAAEGHPKSQRVRISRERVDVGGLPVDVSPARGCTPARPRRVACCSSSLGRRRDKIRLRLSRVSGSVTRKYHPSKNGRGNPTIRWYPL